MTIRLATLALALSLLARTAGADTVAGVQLTPDERNILVSKDVGSERWAITLSLDDATSLQVTGNVFRSDGGEPAFIYCTVTRIDGSADDIANATIHYRCLGTTACAPDACPPWNEIASDIALPGAFFLPH